MVVVAAVLVLTKWPPEPNAPSMPRLVKPELHVPPGRMPHCSTGDSCVLVGAVHVHTVPTKAHPRFITWEDWIQYSMVLCVRKGKG